jgi:hypothetical protein
VLRRIVWIGRKQERNHRQHAATLRHLSLQLHSFLLVLPVAPATGYLPHRLFLGYALKRISIETQQSCCAIVKPVSILPESFFRVLARRELSPAGIPLTGVQALLRQRMSQ